jgi:hypothetical protein
MKPLNRPMFRYGGPIKEGIMSGMKDNTGTGLVGDKRYPKTDGRSHHVAVLPFIGAGLQAAARFLPAAYRGFKAARAYKPMSETLGVKGRLKDIFMPKGGISVPMADKGAGAGFRVGSFLRQNPITTLSLAPQAGAGIYNVGKSAVEAAPGLAKGYVDMLVPGESIFKKDDPKKIEKEGGPPGGGDPDMKVDPKNTVVNDEKLDQLNKERIQKTKDRYYKLMGLDNMKKDAVYDSLIDASKIVQQEGGDLKGAIKSGSLQTQIIDAISKQLDKSSALKRQIDAAVLKGEIEKDIKASDPSAALDKKYKEAQIAVANKKLAGADLKEIKNFYLDKGLSLKGQALFTEAGRQGIETKGILPTEKVDEFMQKNPTLTEADFVNLYQEQLVEAEKDKLPAGDYVVGGRIITIGADGKAKAFVF